MRKNLPHFSQTESSGQYFDQGAYSDQSSQLRWIGLTRQGCDLFRPNFMCCNRSPIMAQQAMVINDLIVHCNVQLETYP